MEAREFGRLIAYERRKKDISILQLTRGLCSESTLKRLCLGDRKIDPFLLQRILGRLGISVNKIGMMYDQVDFRLLLLRDLTEACIEEQKFEKAEYYLHSYREYADGRSHLHQQYMIMMEAMLLVEKDRDCKRAVEKLEAALNMSVPGFDFANLRLYVLAEEEVVLVIALLREKMRTQPSSSGIVYYEEIKTYIESRFEDEEVLLCLRSKLQGIWIDRLLEERKYEEAFQATTEMLTYIGQNGSILHMSYYLDRVLLVEKMTGNSDMIPYRHMREVLYTLYKENGKQWETGELCLWKGLRANAVESLANMLKSEREAAGLTQERLAEILDLDVKTVSRIECGKSKPKTGTLDRMLDFFHFNEKVYDTKIIVGNFALLDLEREIVRLLAYGEVEQAEKQYLQLKNRLLLQYRKNRQYIAVMDVIFDKRKQRKTEEQLLSNLIAAYEMSRGKFEIEKVGNFVPSRMEGIILNNIALIYDSSGRKDECIRLLEQMMRGYENQQADLYHYYSIVSVIYTNLAMCYEETDQFKKAIQLFDRAIQYALYCNRGNRLGFLLKGRTFTLERMTGKANKQAYQDSYQLMKLMCNRADQKRMQEFYFEKFGEGLE